jgi:NF-X1-type zinc finger protein NFXL1
LQKIKWYLLVFLLVLIAVAGLFGLGKVVYQISDWMNEMEAQRARQRLLRAGRL